MLEHRKVYIEFTSRTSVLFVTAFRSKEYQLKPSDDYKAIDMITLQPCKDSDDRYFWAQVNFESDDNDTPMPEYKIVLYVLSGEKRFSPVATVSIAPSENKKKIEVSFKSKS